MMRNIDEAKEKDTETELEVGEEEVFISQCTVLNWNWSMLWAPKDSLMAHFVSKVGL